MGLAVQRRAELVGTQYAVCLALPWCWNVNARSRSSRAQRRGRALAAESEYSGSSMKSAPTPVPLLPVTLLSGFVGAGKTSLLQRLLAEAANLRVAVIVNDSIVAAPGELSSGALLQPLPDTSGAGTEHWITMPSGCICCSLRADLLAAVRELAATGNYDYLLIESAAVTSPVSVAETFAFKDEHGEGLACVAELDTLVTVVDAESFLEDWQSEDELSARELGPSEDDERPVSDLLAEQVEFANVLVLSKLDQVSEEDAALVEAILRQLNPSARILRLTPGPLPLGELVKTGRFDFEQTEQGAGWLAALRGEPAPADEAHGLRSFVYRARVPFHPERLWHLLSDGATWDAVLRSKGLFWLATRTDESGLWSHAGGSVSFEGAGPWYASVPEREWPGGPEEHERIRNDFSEPWGDRRQELVFIGVDLDEARLRAQLDAALLDAGECAEGPAAWSRLTDPFTSWSADGT
jgi:G3E family GTPase